MKFYVINSKVRVIRGSQLHVHSLSVEITANNITTS